MGLRFSRFSGNLDESEEDRQGSQGYHDLEGEEEVEGGRLNSLLAKCCPTIFNRYSRKRRRSATNDETAEQQRCKVIKLDVATDTESICQHNEAGIQATTATCDVDTQTKPESHIDTHPGSNQSIISHQEEAEEEAWLDFPFLNDEATVHHIQVSKVMMIMRGLPGSGKSYLAKKIKTKYPQCVSCSADDFFMLSGQYNFEVDKLKDAHSYSQTKCEEYCRSGSHLILVDNTNVKRWEMKFYLDLAHKYRYLVLIVEPRTPWKFDLNQLVQRNSHGVTYNVLKRRIKDYEIVMPRYLGWFLNKGDSISLLKEANQLLLLALLSSQEFSEAFRKFSGCENLQEMLNFYSRENCMGSSKHIIHMTTKFFRFKKNEGNVDLDMYGNYLGLSRKLTICGFCITKDTFSAKILLSQEQKGLWEQNDGEVVRPDSSQNGHKTRPVVCVEDDLYLDDSDTRLLSSVRTSAQKVSVTDLTELQGKRAHLTIGTSGDTRPVQSGLDTIQCMNLINHSQHKYKLPSGPGIPSGALIKLSPSQWFIQLERYLTVDAVFTGSY